MAIKINQIIAYAKTVEGREESSEKKINLSTYYPLL
jgi:hypothetical protein